MAGTSWIKLRTSLPDDPRIDRIAQACDVAFAEAFTAFVRLLCWADSATEDGLIRHARAEFIDRQAGLRGIAAAMVAVGWGEITDDGFRFVDYERHNGQSAKRRANNAIQSASARDRKRESESTEPRQQSVSKPSADHHRDCPPREEKRREEEREDREGASAPSAATRSDDADASPRSVSARGRSSKRVKSPDPMRWDREAGWSGITDDDRARWAKAYPAVDIDRQLAAMTEWLIASPAKAHKSNWRKFVTNWLSRKQDQGGDVRNEIRPRDAPPASRYPTAQSDRERINESALEKAQQRRLQQGTTANGRHP